jgi:ribosomal protein S12 methylthiotransferase accessory factor
MSVAAHPAGQDGRGSAAGQAPKIFRDGTHRTVPPRVTVEKAERLFGPLGITRVANVTGLDCIGIPVVMVCRPNARSLSVSQGKGIDLDAARASGVMESVELFHAERIDLPLKLGSWNDLRFSHRLAPLEQLPRLSLGNWRPDRPLLWIEADDLIAGRRAWLPYEMVHMNYTVPLPTGSGCFVMSSNGLASGNHWLEAVCHGLCEVVERDASSLFRFRSDEAKATLRVDLDTVTDPACRRLLAMYEAAGVNVAVWDVTSDVGVPVFTSVVLDRQPSPFRRIGPLKGVGCHPTREVALLRALTEAAQARLTYIAGSRDDVGWPRYAEVQDERMIKSRQALLEQRGRRHFEEAPTETNGDVGDDVSSVLRKLARVGIEHALVVDLSKPMFDIPVARVVVPGLEPHHAAPGFVPGQRIARLLSGRGPEAPA